MMQERKKLTTFHKWLLGQYGLVAHPELSKLDLGVYLRLIDHFNPATKRCFPAASTLAEALGCTVRSVRSSIAKLEEQGLIKVVRRRGPLGVNLYSFPKWPQKVNHMRSVMKGRKEAKFSQDDD